MAKREKKWGTLTADEFELLAHLWDGYRLYPAPGGWFLRSENSGFDEPEPPDLIRGCKDAGWLVWTEKGYALSAEGDSVLAEDI